MANRLKISAFQLLLAIGITLLLVSVAQAGQSHHHQSHSDVVSPFDKVSNDKPLHCILNLHLQGESHHCPHSNQGDKNNSTELRADCGTHSGTTNSSSASLLKDASKIATYFSLELSQKSWKIDLVSGLKHLNISRSIEHPPHIS